MTQNDLKTTPDWATQLPQLHSKKQVHFYSGLKPTVAINWPKPGSFEVDLVTLQAFYSVCSRVQNSRVWQCLFTWRKRLVSSTQSSNSTPKSSKNDPRLSHAAATVRGQKTGAGLQRFKAKSCPNMARKRHFGGQFGHFSGVFQRFYVSQKSAVKQLTFAHTKIH